MLKISVRPELSMNSSSPALTPFSTLISNWSTGAEMQSAQRIQAGAADPALPVPPMAHAPSRGSAAGATGVGAYPGRFMSHEVGVLET